MTKGIRIRKGIEYLLTARYQDSFDMSSAEMAVEHVERLLDDGKDAFWVKSQDGSYSVYVHGAKE